MVKKKEPRVTWGGSRLAEEEHLKALADEQARRAARLAAESRPTPAKDRQSPLPFVGAYHEYLDSPQWRKKRRKALRHYKHRCVVCGSADRLHVHHRHYRTLFRESMDDLEVRCAGCHANEHEGDVPGVVDPLTAQFVAMFR